MPNIRNEICRWPLIQSKILDELTYQGIIVESQFQGSPFISLHKKWSFPLSISAVNVKKSLMEKFIFCVMFNWIHSIWLMIIFTNILNLQIFRYMCTLSSSKGKESCFSLLVRTKFINIQNKHSQSYIKYENEPFYYIFKRFLKIEQLLNSFPLSSQQFRMWLTRHFAAKIHRPCRLQEGLLEKPLKHWSYSSS